MNSSLHFNLFCTRILDVVNKSGGAIAERKFDFDPLNLTDNAGVGSIDVFLTCLFTLQVFLFYYLTVGERLEYRKQAREPEWTG